MRDEFFRVLSDPPKRFRPIPFWSWNEKLDESETRRQIRAMDAAGIGGYFMHARGGLQTEYMGDSWMANIQAGVEEARDTGMGAWLYDENGWPSGFGDGRVSGLGEEYQQKYLRFEEVDQEMTRPDRRTIINHRLGDGRLLHFYYDVNPFYVDTLDGKVTEQFLDAIYQPYYEVFGTDFGKALPGFFTDEPQVSRNGIPWSLTLPKQYWEMFQEDLLVVLPQLFLPIDDYQRTRYRFWYLVQELFVTNFTEPIYDWCTNHGAQLTGHMVLEESFLAQLTSNGAVMPHYEFFHMPGMDWLGRHINPPTTPLQVSSVAHQLGKQQILSETFALTGWNVSFGELKWMFDWQMVRGITQLCQHLQGYSLRGIRKRDYPPSLFYQQPWWDKYRLFNDYVSRLGMLLAEGKADFPVLVLHTQSSAWLHYDAADNPGLADLFNDFLDVTETLEANHIPFHYGDERILKRHGQVDGTRLVVGQEAYSVVIVPPAVTLTANTVELLQAFGKAGGSIFWVGQKPSLVAGQVDSRLDDLLTLGESLDEPASIPACLPEDASPVAVTTRDGRPALAVAVTQRTLPASLVGVESRLFFAANSDLDAEYSVVITVPGRAVRILDAEDGSLRSLPYTHVDDRLQVAWRLAPGGSLALLTADADEAFPDAPLWENLDELTPLPSDLFVGSWDLDMHDPNALTLDYCDFWFDGELQAENEHVSVIQKRALDLERSVDIAMRFTFTLSQDFTPDDAALVIERPELYTMELNGQLVENTPSGWYRDRSFIRVPLTKSLRQGENELVLRTRFSQSDKVYEQIRKAAAFEAEKNKLTYDQEIEAVYLIGTFGVETPGSFESLPRRAVRYSGPFVLNTPPTAVTLGDLTRQGLAFFNGTVTLRKEIELTDDSIDGYKLQLKDVQANVAALRVNGEHVREWFWQPYEASLQGRLRSGTNTIELTLTGNLRNLLGPHHLEEGESYAVHPGTFFKEPNVWGHSRWNDDYCFVEFGVTL